MMRSTHHKRDDDQHQWAQPAIPPPITQSIYVLSTRRSSAETPSKLAAEPWYTRKQRQFERDIQLLLDVQADRLAHGGGANSPASAADPAKGYSGSESGSHTPRSDHLTTTPVRERSSLRRARKGLYTTMRQLALLKGKEALDLDARHADLRSAFDRTSRWTKQHWRFQTRSKGIEDASELQAAKELRTRASRLQPEIDSLQAKLKSLRLEQLRLMEDAKRLEMRVQDELSSCQQGLQALDRNLNAFVRDLPDPDLKSKIVEELTSAESKFPASPSTGSTRLIQAHEVLGKELEMAEARREGIENERDALEEGAALWKDVVHEVESLERRLTRMVEHSVVTRDHTGQGGGGLHDNDSDRPDPAVLLEQMQDVASFLQDKYDLAEARGWKLLIAAIGAEVEAVHQGQNVLRDAFRMGDELDVSPCTATAQRPFINDAKRDANVGETSSHGSHEENDEILELDNAFKHSDLQGSTLTLTAQGHYDDDNDEPDPELLISRHDTDDE